MSDDDASSSAHAKGVQWSSSIEILLAKWCDEAKCFEWMHTEGYEHFDKRSKTLVIVSNVLTAVSGLSNVIAGGYSVNGFQLSWVFGSLSIGITITNMLQEKLGYASKAIRHEHYAAQWNLIRRKIEEELSIPPESRKDCGTFLKYLRQDINQVSTDGNTLIPDFIKTACFTKFNSVPQFDLPDICGQVEHTKIYVKSPIINEPLLPRPVQ
jgi:hypothetical protein